MPTATTSNSSSSKHIAIIGAGIAGLTTALSLCHLYPSRVHNLTVYDSSPGPSSGGAGIQIPPNSARILARLGLLEKIEDVALEPKAMHLRRFDTGDVLSTTEVVPGVRKVFGFPYLLVHRADLLRVLHGAVSEQGVKIVWNAQVVVVDADSSTVSFSDGQEVKADIIIGADGVGSVIRGAVDALTVRDLQGGSHRIFHALVPASTMKSRVITAKLLEDPRTNCWIGPDRHVVAYPIRKGEMYNVAMAHVGKAAVGEWEQEGDVSEMQEAYKDFDLVLKEVLNLVAQVKSWKLTEMPTLQQWVSSSGNVVLVGDAAHAMLPYLAQGAAQAVEDAFVLASCIQAVEGNDITMALRTHEKIRRDRVERIVNAAHENGEVWHLPDGPEQNARDDILLGRKVETGVKNTSNGKSHKSQMADPKFQAWLFGYDAEQEVRKYIPNQAV